MPRVALLTTRPASRGFHPGLGEDVIIVPSVSDEDAKKVYPEGWRAPRPYMRFVAQPGTKKS